MPKMTIIEEFVKGMKTLSKLYPNANTGAEHDEFHIYSGEMADEDGNPTMDPNIKKELETIGFYWNEEDHYYYYFT